jgi:hypothetical protein
MRIEIRHLITGFTLVFASQSALSAEPGVQIAVELGATYQSKNDVQIPNDREGTRFELDDITGSGPWGTVRVDINWNINEKHGVRAVLAPLSFSERGNIDEPVDFAGETYSPDEPLKASYTFNSWRLGYRYNFYEGNDWELWAGGTLKVRDADIELKQGGTKSNDDDVGVVPLLYFGANYRINERWWFTADFDGLAGGPGRAFDISAKLLYDPGSRWRIGIGYRTLEGGVDNDDVYNFAWFNSVLVTADYRF